MVVRSRTRFIKCSYAYQRIEDFQPSKVRFSVDLPRHRIAKLQSAPRDEARQFRTIPQNFHTAPMSVAKNLHRSDIPLYTWTTLRDSGRAIPQRRTAEPNEQAARREARPPRIAQHGLGGFPATSQWSTWFIPANRALRLALPMVSPRAWLNHKSPKRRKPDHFESSEPSDPSDPSDPGRSGLHDPRRTPHAPPVIAASRPVDEAIRTDYSALGYRQPSDRRHGS
jgi:hypothetical protein